jgi:hypothetical protein
MRQLRAEFSDEGVEPDQALFEAFAGKTREGLCSQFPDEVNGYSQEPVLDRNRRAA